MATVGAYAIRRLVFDVGVMFVAGIVAFFLRRSGYSVAGMVLGLILGKIGEQTFAQAMQMLYYDLSGYLDRPIGLALLLAGVVTLMVNAVRAMTGRRGRAVLERTREA